MPAIPEKFKATMRTLLEAEYQDFIQSMENTAQRFYGLRANTLKITPDRLQALAGIRLKPTPWCDTGFYYQEESRPAKSPLYQAGLYYIQEPSAMSAAAVLPISAGDRVLDVCAAPGGKTTQLAAKLNGTGVIVSNDVSGSRCIALNKNIALMGIKNAVVTNEDPGKLKKNFIGWFDKILIDAPCSGEGMFRKNDEAIKGWLEHNPEECAAWQENILNHTAEMLKPDGMLLYSTCTFNPLENERQIQRFLDTHTDFEISPIDHAAFGLSPGRTDWAGGDERLRIGCARIWPHKCDGEGHFMALIHRQPVGAIMNRPLNNHQPNDRPAKKIDGIDFFHEWCERYLRCELSGNLGLRKNALYLEPLDMPDLHGIRAYKTGLYLGDLKAKRFEPSTAFALALKKEEFANTVDFRLDAPEVSRYLNGESFDVTAQEGYNLFCVEGYPLGFGKVIGGRLKNRRL